MDNCGTGGDGCKASILLQHRPFVLAGAGVKVAKHGNRSISSKTGSADVLEELGVNLYLEPDMLKELLGKWDRILILPHRSTLILHG